MVLSMTGYGRAEQERSGRDITVEIKSVNSRYFEYTSRMPRSFAFLDDKLKKLVNATISRGKTELALTVVNIGAPEASISVNLDLAKGYLDAIGEMSSALGIENDVTAGTLTRFSDIFTTRKAETDEEQLWADVKAVAEAAVENFVAMRAAEGEKLRADILSRLVYLEQAVGEIEQTSAERVQKYTEKLYAKLKALLPQVQAETDSGSLRGLEGAGAAIYFDVFDRLILNHKDVFSFTGRSRRPPLDPCNALLSFAYSLLANDCAAALEAVGLDSYVGFLHTDRPGRQSLAADLMEELRPCFADRFVLSAVNLGRFSAKDFEVQENGAVYLSENARKTFLQGWQEKKREEIRHPYLEEKLSWGMVPYAQALLLARYLRGDLDDYPPFLWK